MKRKSRMSRAAIKIHVVMRVTQRGEYDELGPKARFIVKAPPIDPILDVARRERQYSRLTAVLVDSRPKQIFIALVSALDILLRKGLSYDSILFVAARSEDGTGMNGFREREYRTLLYAE
jgi:hypothetical protein